MEQVFPCGNSFNYYFIMGLFEFSPISYVKIHFSSNLSIFKFFKIDSYSSFLLYIANLFNLLYVVFHISFWNVTFCSFLDQSYQKLFTLYFFFKELLLTLLRFFCYIFGVFLVCLFIFITLSSAFFWSFHYTFCIFLTGTVINSKAFFSSNVRV